ncbi:MAG: Com family DNA-binding transcriptional regulator [Candidatus Magnetoovum sp. WYHC-5]|nr:Com family DNA-binding transcriptional regulator [Candidatus Magnetoovum sp. WYHC-5]
MKENRCANCRRLLFLGEAIFIEIKCPRCKTVNVVKISK